MDLHDSTFNSETREVTGTVNSVIFSADDSYFTILAVESDSPHRDEVTVVGEIVEPVVGQRITARGEWTEHEQYGRQFEADSIEVLPPASEDGMRQYLAEFVPGIGPALAERIVAEFGEETFDVIDQDPQRLQDVPGIGKSKSQRITRNWQEAERTREIMAILTEHGLSQNLAIRIYDEYQAQAADVIRSDPYQLVKDVRGIGFKQADKIARSNGVSRSDPVRWEAVVLYVLEEAEREGHCFLPAEELIEKIESETGGDRDRAAGAVRRLVEQQELTLDRELEAGQGPAVYRRSVYRTEETVASRLTDQARVRPDWARSTGRRILDTVDFSVDYNESQTEAIKRCMTGGVLILTGGPGTGKTTTVNGMIELLQTRGITVDLAAPTGRAAKRLSQATGQSAQTLHRLLEYNPTQGFGHDEDDPLETELVIVDEVSMVDLFLMNRLLAALPEEAGLVLVGDADQLPSVGAGTVFNDCIESGVLPVVELDRIYRQARNSGVVMNAHRINRGEIPEPGYDDFFYEEMDDEAAEDFIVDVAAKRMPEKTGLDPRRDIQIISPMYDRIAGVNRLNERLQERLTSSGDETPTRFRIGDKVMQTQNNYDKDVFNGNVGFVLSYDDEDDRLTVEFPDSDTRATYDSTERRRELDLAYAITVHKSQGSEYPAVLIPVVKGHTYLLKRPLLYTAVTRAERYVIMAGQKRTLHIAVNREEQETRWTGLRHRLLSRAKRDDSDAEPKPES